MKSPIQKRPVNITELSETMQKALKDLEEVSEILAALGLKKPYLTCAYKDIDPQKKDKK